MSKLRILRAQNDILIDEDGRTYIDMFSANGTVWLGHAHRGIASSIADQLEQVWITGALETSVAVRAKTAVEGLLPASHCLAGLYSTGMEAAEFAIRYARVVTKRNGVIGFEHSMHGKSMATAFLGWDNDDGVRVPSLRRLPFVDRAREEEILTLLKSTLGGGDVAAVFIEPLQGTGGGYQASPEFYAEVHRLCQRAGTLLVFDEILTGLYRTGQVFYFSALGFVPDVVLIGKAMGNGFPVSGVVVDRRHPVEKRMLPGSTYAGNALACAAVIATMGHMGDMDIVERVAHIENTITVMLAPLDKHGIKLRGKGALWILELPPRINIDELVVNIYKRGIAVGYTGRLIRLLPAATIEPTNLAHACTIIVEELLKAGQRRG